jgi:thiamine-phosphate pyrophosphorylase
VGQEDLTPASVRLIAGPDAVVGLSTHTLEQCEAASREPVSYIAVGPVFNTITKSTGYDPVGLAHVQRVAAKTSARGVPLVAIGGISLERARSVIEAGARSVAVITDMLATGDPTKRVEQFLRELGETS